MFSVTINIAGQGTPLKGGGNSFAGHMWYSLYDGGGDEPLSYGLAPVDGASGLRRALGEGYVPRDDDTIYKTRDFSLTIEITQEQYNSMKSFGENPSAYGFNTFYNGLSNSCIDFTWKAMQLGGLNIINYQGEVWPTWNGVSVSVIVAASQTLYKQNQIWSGIWADASSITYNKVIDSSFLAARTIAPARRDPLVLDLDGDGLETVGIDTVTPILFDHNADGVKTATGWVTPDDAFLVLERNGDGRIDSGSELFGDATPLSAGGTAADGFAALAQEDTNGDGLVNASDERFTSLRLWRDANQDGISQADELITLASQNIAALIVGRTANSTLLANGNQIADLGGFVRNDGSDGTLGAVEQLADINLASSPFYSEFTDRVPLTEQAQTLPELQGAGMVRSLRQAASLPTDQGRELATQLVAFAAETTRSGQMAKLDSLLKAWAETSSMATTASGAFAGVNLTLSFAGVTKETPAWQFWLDKLSILERFNGQPFLPVPAAGTTLAIDFYSTRELLLDASYAALKQSFYEALVTQTRLKPYLDKISLSLDDNGIAMDFSALETAMDARHALDAGNALIDRIELIKYARRQLGQSGWSGSEKAEQWIGDAENSGVWEALCLDLGAEYSGAGTAANDFNLADSGSSVFYAGAGDDVSIGAGGNDTLSGVAGDDLILGNKGSDALYGGDGNDLIDGGANNDTLSGGSGADTYLFSKGSGQDTINNYDSEAVGTNPDTIQLGAGIVPCDVTLTRTGDDLLISVNDTNDNLRVQSYFYQDGAACYAVENIKFANGTVWDIATVKTKVIEATIEDDALYGYATNDVLSGRDGNDTLYGYAGDDFLDGGTGRDSIQGGDGEDTLKGNTGADTLYGGNGNDILQGDEHNDILYGDAGNDLLDGGAGNDSLSGGTGADTYLFTKGSGQDTINNYDSEAVGTNPDAILLDAEITTSDVTLTRTGDDLQVSINGTYDSLRISSYFRQDGATCYTVENIKFADGTAWDYAATKARLSTVTLPAAVTIAGTAASETLIGGPDNDYIYGYSGSDVLDGGNGNDTLDGGAGNDTYLFGKGLGNDTINSYEATVGKIDVIQLGANVRTADVSLKRNGDALLLSINGCGDSLQVTNYFVADASAGYQVEQIKFADGTAWDIAEVKRKVVSATSDNDALTGYASDDTLAGLAGDDILYGRTGDDTLDGGAGEDLLWGDNGDDVLKGGPQSDRLYGGSGNDILQGNEQNDALYGEAGNDLLDGGTGNDTLDGGTGNDTYLFGKRSGKDIVNTYDATVGKIDVIQLGADVQTTDVNLKRNGDALSLALNGSADSLQVNNYFIADASAGYQVEQIKFADGTTWDIAEVKRKVVTATSDNDALTGYASDDTLAGLAGDDLLHGRTGNDTLDGNSGEDQLWGDDGDDVLRGGTQSDRLYGGSGNDILQGNEHNDALYGDAGDDLIDGGAGNDTLDGGIGNDIYRFGKGSGKDTISAYETTVGKLDVIQLGAEVRTSDVNLKRNGDALLLSINGSTDSLLINNYFTADATAGYQVEQIKFADGTTCDVAAVKTKVMTATAEDDALYGYATNDILSGDDGNDTLYGGNGNDILQGNGHNDILYGGAGDDLIDGGAGNDTLDGGTGNDTYLFGKGSGKDIISAHEATVGKLDVIQLSAEVQATDVSLKRNGDTLLLSVNGGADSLQVNNYFIGDAIAGYQVEQIKFADGTAWDVAAVKRKVVAATSDNDTLTGYASADALAGLAGNDVLYGRADNDTLDGGAGEDQLWGDDGDDVLEGGAGNDSLNGGIGDDIIDGGLGADRMAGGPGNDIYVVDNAGDTVSEKFNEGSDLVRSSVSCTLSSSIEDLTLTGSNVVNGTGNALDNTLEGNAGNNFLDGGTGNDIYIFMRGGGHDTIKEAADSTADKKNTLRFALGISATDVTFTRSANDLCVGIINSSDTVTIKDFFLYDTPFNPQNPIQQIEFYDKTRWAIKDILGQLMNTHPAGTVDISGEAVENQTLTAANTLTDVDGLGTIGYQWQSSTDGINWNTIVGATASSFTLSQAQVGQQLRVMAFYTDGHDITESVVSHATTIIAKPASATANGSSGNDTRTDLSDDHQIIGAPPLIGGTGDDTLVGGTGNDTLIGGSGSDALHGGEGDDTLRLAVDGNWSAIYSAYNIGSPGQPGSGEQFDVVGMIRVFDFFDGGSGEDLLEGTSGDDAIFLEDSLSPFLESMGPRLVDIEAIRTGDGNDVVDLTSDRYTCGNVLLAGGNGNDVLWASAGNDAIEGGAGNDRLDGGAGSDLLAGGAGNDTLITGTGTDLIAFNQGDGFDAVSIGTGSTALSLGGGIAYSTLSLSKSGNDLVLDSGSGDGMSFKDWYLGTANHNVLKLQVVADAMTEFAPGGSDPLLDHKIENFDFKGLVGAFDAARAATPTLSSWALANALTQFHLAGSDNAALGGDLAYQYGRNGTLSGIGINVAQQVLGEAGFGSQVQTLQPLASLQVGTQRLS